MTRKRLQLWARTFWWKPWSFRREGSSFLLGRWWYSPFHFPIPSIQGGTNVFAATQAAFRFYADGTESGSVALANENTNISLFEGDSFQLRIRLDETGSGSASGATTDDYQLQYSKNGGAFTSITAATTNVCGFASTNTTDAGATTQRLTAGAGSFVAGKVSEDGLVDDWQLTANNYGELLFVCKLQAADLANGDTLDFRVLRNGATITYSVTPRITASTAQSITATAPTVTVTAPTATAVPGVAILTATAPTVTVSAPAAALSTGGRPSTILDNLEASWELDEASGDAIDSHDSLDLTDVNTVGTSGGWRNFVRANSEAFTRASSAELEFGDEPITIVAEIELASKPASSDMCIIQKTTGGNGEYFFQYRNSDDSDRLAFAVFGTAGFGDFGIALANNFGSPSTATPTFLVGWHDPTANVVGVQVNDGTADTVSHSAGIFTGTGNIELSGIEFGNYWDGRLRRVRIYRRVLTADEKTWLYNNGSGRSYDEMVGSGPITATAPTVTVSAPAAAVVANVSIAASAPQVTVTAPTAQIARAIPSTSSLVTVTAPAVQQVSRTLSATSSLVTVSPPTATPAPGLATIPATSSLVTVTAPTVQQLSRTLPATASLITVTAPAAGILVSGGGAQNVTATAPTITVTAPTVQQLSRTLPATSSLVTVTAPTALIGRQVAATAPTITVTAPTALVGRQVAAASSLVTVTAPTALIGRQVAATASLVTVTAPTALVGRQVIATSSLVTVTAPTATVVPGLKTITATASVINVVAPAAEIVAAGAILASSSVVTVTAPTAVIAAGVATITATAPTITVVVGTPVVHRTASATSSLVTVTSPTAVLLPGQANLVATAPTVTVVAPDASISAGSAPPQNVTATASVIAVTAPTASVQTFVAVPATASLVTVVAPSATLHLLTRIEATGPTVVVSPGTATIVAGQTTVTAEASVVMVSVPTPFLVTGVVPTTTVVKNIKMGLGSSKNISMNSSGRNVSFGSNSGRDLVFGS